MLLLHPQSMPNEVNHNHKNFRLRIDIELLLICYVWAGVYVWWNDFSENYVPIFKISEEGRNVVKKTERYCTTYLYYQYSILSPYAIQ